MSTSGTTTYTIARDDLITEALKILEVLEEGQSASATQLSDSLPPLQLLIKSMANKGLFLWKRTNISVTPLVEDQANYTFGPSNFGSALSLRIYDVTLKETSSSIERPIRPMSLEEYESLSNKTTSGQPTQYYWKKLNTSSILYLWPVPDATTAAGYTVEVVAQTQFEDMTATATNFDFPVEWLDAIVYQLAVRLAPMFGYPLEKRKYLKMEAAEKLEEALDFDQEDASVYIKPSQRWK